jgi:co-chaperonin GroES (HSP10)
MATAIQMVHARDPREELWLDVEPYLADITVLGARVLVAVYVRPEQTKSGILLPAQTRHEDVYQGKVGLVLKCGPLAFQDDATHRFGNQVPTVGDWVVFSVGDTFGMELGKRRCRTVEDVDVHLIINRPDILL